MNLTNKVQNVLALAAAHADQGDMADSARLALKDAQHLFSGGRIEAAAQRAEASLLYSVGAFHPDTKTARLLCQDLGDHR
jgi:hypothetical protein